MRTLLRIRTAEIVSKSTVRCFLCAREILSVRLRRGGGGVVELDVADTGEGIAPENLARIFTYGFTTKPDGHGFGLHTCANYVKQMGGQLSVASDGPGRGARFTLAFPC